MSRSSLLLVLVALVGCGDDGSPGGSGGGGGAPQAGSNAGGSAGDGGSGAAGGNGGGLGTGGEGGATGGAGGGSIGNECGGIANVMCASDSYCDFPSDECGADDRQGQCAPRPTDCPAVDDPACGCDGTIYGSACEANASGVDVAVGGCTAPPGDFACGPGFCSLASQACFQSANDVAEPPPFFYSCGDLPPACDEVAVPTCVCAQSAATNCGGSCEDVIGGGVIIHCPGG